MVVAVSGSCKEKEKEKENKNKIHLLGWPRYAEPAEVAVAGDSRCC